MSVEADALAAFERGDFKRARELAKELSSSPDEPTRAAAQQILQRTSLDPAIVWITGACVVFFVLVVVLALR